MARATLTPVKMTGFQLLSGDVTFTALTADGGEIAWDGKDVHAVILVKNGSADTNRVLTIKGGNSEYGIDDTNFTIPFGKTKALSIESGFFKNIDGTDKGKVVVAGPATGYGDLSIAVVFLP
jgi:hypothetical protein